jgi:hypothetical protein
MARGVKFWCDSGANIHSQRSEIQTWDELGMTEEEFNALTEDERYEMAEEWAADHLDIGVEAVD